MWCNTVMLSVSGWAQIEHNTHNPHQQSASTTTLHAWRTTTDERSSLLTTLRLLARLAAGGPTNFARPRYVLERYSLLASEIRSGIGTCMTLKVTVSCLAMTYELAYPFFWNWTSLQWVTGSRSFDTSGVDASRKNYPARRRHIAKERIPPPPRCNT